MPLDLRRPVDRETEFPAEHRAVRERRAVLWALENNCYYKSMIVVARYGFKDRASIHAKAMARRVGYESHIIALEAVDLANMIRQRHPGKQDAEDAE